MDGLTVEFYKAIRAIISVFIVDTLNCSYDKMSIKFLIGVQFHSSMKVLRLHPKLLLGECKLFYRN